MSLHGHNVEMTLTPDHSFAIVAGSVTMTQTSLSTLRLKHMITQRTTSGWIHLSCLLGLMGLSSLSQAAISIEQSPRATTSITTTLNQPGSAQIAWSSDEASRLMREDEDGEPIMLDSRSLPNRSGSLTTIVERVSEPVRQLGSNIVNKLQGQPDVSASAALLLDAETGEVLYSKNIDRALPIASITKIMTAVVTADARLNMSETITLQPIDFAGAGGKNSSSTLRAGDEMNRAELLLVALMKSENPAAAALGRTYPGGYSAFIAAMNRKARDLGMMSTFFGDPTGLDPRNVSSAHDLGLLVRNAYQYGLIRQFSATPHYDFNLGNRILKSNNTNALVRDGSWNIGLSKTGYIREAGRCVVMQANINQRPTVLVLLGANSSAGRTQDANRLFGWVSSIIAHGKDLKN
jgi:D-alanyl-D-alanine endopeptidase (penicillin-binding protein 7)